MTLAIAIDVSCTAEHAFETWTAHIDTWWPRDHTVSGDRHTEVILQRELGGRIFERTNVGQEHEWGVLTVWEPPTRLANRWYPGRNPEMATDVDIRFVPSGPHSSRVAIQHSGFDSLENEAITWRERNRVG